MNLIGRNRIQRLAPPRPFGASDAKTLTLTVALAYQRRDSLDVSSNTKVRSTWCSYRYCATSGRRNFRISTGACRPAPQPLFDRLIGIGGMARRFWEGYQWTRRDAGSWVQRAWRRQLV